MVDEELYKQVCEKIAEFHPQMIEFQKQITRIPALSPTSGGEGEWDKAMFIREFLQKRGVRNIDQVDAPDSKAKNGKRPSLIISIPGKSSDRTIWIMSHTDVVPAGDLQKWDSDPWKVIEKDGKLYGRGVEDNQQSLTSSVFCALALLELNIQPEYDLKLILVADEETGSDYGLTYILKNHKEWFRKDDLILVPDFGLADASEIEVAEKGIIWIKFTTRGKQCHASEPEKGNNAFRAASFLVVRLNQLYEIFDVKNSVFNPPSSTFEPTKKEPNVPNVNTIPGEDIFYLDCRLLPEYSLDQLFTEVDKICRKTENKFGVQIEYTTVQKEAAAPATDKDAPVVQRLSESIKAIYNVEPKPVGIGGGTVAAIFRRAGLPAAVWSTIDDTCHQPNEYCVIDNMVKDSMVFAHFCLQE
jgi:succinyl-diaminopimelate desuccinylase